MTRFRISMDVFERLSTTFESDLINRVRPVRETGRRAMVVAPEGAVDGVEDGTWGESVGLRGSTRSRACGNPTGRQWRNGVRFGIRSMCGR